MMQVLNMILPTPHICEYIVSSFQDNERESQLRHYLPIATVYSNNLNSLLNVNFIDKEIDNGLRSQNFPEHFHVDWKINYRECGDVVVEADYDF